MEDVLKKYQIIYKEEAILAAPSGKCDFSHSDKFGQDIYRPVCLACFKSISISTKINFCSNCRWPMCNNESCEKEEFHVKLECIIFEKNKILASGFVLELLFSLRSVLLKTIFPSRWEKLMILKYEQFPTDSCNKEFELTKWFIHEYCKIVDFDAKLIQRIVNIKKRNAFEIQSYGETKGESYYGIAVFQTASTFLHSCVANSIWNVYRNNNSILTEFIKYIPTSIKRTTMKDLSIIRDTNCLFYGTIKRRKILREKFGLLCKCSRCSDPTENGSYFSGLICQTCKYSLQTVSSNKNKDFPGVLLMISSTTGFESEEIWKCSYCEKLTHSSEDVQQIIERAEMELDSILCSLENEETIALMLNEFLLKFAGKVLHRNHYLVIEAEQCWLENSAVFTQLQRKHNEGVSGLYRQFLWRAQHCLNVYAMILPSDFFDPVMMIHYKLAIVQEALYFQSRSRDKKKETSIIHTSKSKINQDSLHMPNVTKILKSVDKALLIHNESSIVLDPFVNFRKITLLNIKRKLNKEKVGLF